MNASNLFCKLHLIFIVILLSFCVSVKEYDPVKVEKVIALSEKNITKEQERLITEIGYCMIEPSKYNHQLFLNYFILAFKNKKNEHELRQLLIACKLDERPNNYHEFGYNAIDRITLCRFDKFLYGLQNITNKCRYTQIQTQISFNVGLGVTTGISNCIDNYGSQWVEFYLGPSLLLYSFGLDAGLESYEHSHNANSLSPVTVKESDTNDYGFKTTFIIGKFRDRKLEDNSDITQIATGISLEGMRLNIHLGLVLLPRWILPKQKNFLDIRRNIILESFFLSDKDLISIMSKKEKEKYLIFE